MDSGNIYNEALSDMSFQQWNYATKSTSENKKVFWNLFSTLLTLICDNCFIGYGNL